MTINLRFAFRALFKAPLITLTAIVSLSLGIGANAAIFSIFNQILLRALPVYQPEQLINLEAPGPKPGSQSCNQAGDCDSVFSYPMFRDLQRVQTALGGIAAHRRFNANLAYQGQTENGDGMAVSGSYFPVLGIRATLGRLLGEEDDRTVGDGRVAVLSHAYWMTRFAADPGILNRTLIVNGQAMSIVGVAPAGFDGTTLGTEPQVFVPVTMYGYMQPGWKNFDNRRAYWIYLFARLKPGTSLEQAYASLNTQYQAIINDVEVPLQKGMSEQTLSRFRTKPLLLKPGARGQSNVSGNARKPIILLLCVTGFVLVIACANVANLLLARGAARASEMAVRLSIGAGRRHLVAQLLAESCLLAGLAGCISLLIARWTLGLIVSLMPAEAAATIKMDLDLNVLLFSAALTLGTGFLFGLFPALHSTRPDLISAIKGAAGQPSGARTASRFRASLATAQIALSLALLTGAGLFMKSLFNVSRVQLGLRVENVVTFSIAPMLNGYSPDRSRALFERLEDDLAAQPGVKSVAGSIVPLLGGSSWGSDLSVEGYAAGPDTDMNSRYNEISPGYFATLGIPLISGREFRRSDAAGAPKVAIVNDAFAKKFNLGREAVSRHIGRDRGKPPDIEIVGLVPDTKYSEVKDAVPPQFFTPYRQDERLGFLSFYVATSGKPELLMQDLPKVVSRLDPNLPVQDLRTMQQQVRENVFLDRMISVLSAAFACLATLLAAVGLYGTLSYTVLQRTREIGLRMALGADPGRVRRMVLMQVGWMTLFGGAIGLVAAFLLGRLAESQLFEMNGSDPFVFCAAAIVLTMVALAAGAIPAVRASRIDPMTALRYE